MRIEEGREGTDIHQRKVNNTVKRKKNAHQNKIKQI